MPKSVTALLVFAALVWSAAHAPGWSKGTRADAAASTSSTHAGDRIQLASLAAVDEKTLVVEFDRAQNPVDAQWAAWHEQGEDEDGAATFDDASRAAPPTRLSAGAPSAPNVSDFRLNSAPHFDLRGSAPSGGRGHPGPNSGGSNSGGSNAGGTNTAPPASGTGGESAPESSTPENPSTNPEAPAPETQPPQVTPPITTPPETVHPWIPETPDRPTVTVPEPGAMSLFALGLVGLALSRRRRHRSQQR